MNITLKNSAPFFKALPKNLFAGFVVSLVALPLGLGLALASEAPPISGIIAAVVGGILVSVLGGSNVTITGPGNGLVIVTLSAVTTLGNGDMYQGYLYTLAAVVVSGILILLLGFLKMGRLADFFPSSAIEGMLAAIGVGILAKQFHIMLGNNHAKGSIIELLQKIPAEVSSLFVTTDQGVLFAAFVGIGSLLIMIFYSKIRNPYFQLVPAPMWILILTIGMAYAYKTFGTPYPIGEEFLIQLPKDLMNSMARPDFTKMFSKDFGLAVSALTLIASIESLLSIKAVDKLDPLIRRSNVNKDLKALGMATVVSGLLGGLNVVTVIARSSVNVNNGASNRTSNFFHAAILLVLVVLFQDQLRLSPLSALAAILVYTGYRLATPKTLAKLVKIGREQILIFLATLITTLYTNLIMGISVGILVTFLIHVVLNKSISLFLFNLTKPNILMFKESDSGTFYVSVKYFCTFLNFYKLKSKLDMIPENETVVIDFSLCDFVDHTVMEGLNGYVQSFSKKGGNVEIIGLDKHEADTKHPFAIRKAIPFSRLLPVGRYFTKRQGLLERAASEFNCVYNPDKETDTRFLKNFIFFTTRKIPYLYNRLENKEKHYSLFDVEFTEGEFIAREVVKTTVLYLDIPQEAPIFTLDKEGLLHFLYGLEGFVDIDIDRHPDFNKRFFLSGENPEAIRKLFTDDLVLFFESNPYYHLECNGTGLLIIKKERLLSVQEIKAMLYFGEQLQRFFPKKVAYS